tara:strand:+ start:159 stop:464 length:306 start_codon:yes stop_codon:yes gene_type:complete
MIIYNVTVTVDESILSEWLIWMKEKHIPEVLNTGLFIKAQLKKIISDKNNTFAVAYSCANMQDLHQYQVNFASKIQQKHIKKFGDKAVAFRTILEILNNFN